MDVFNGALHVKKRRLQERIKDFEAAAEQSVSESNYKEHKAKIKKA